MDEKSLQDFVRPYRFLTEEALRAGVLMERGPPKPAKGEAILAARAALTTKSDSI